MKKFFIVIAVIFTLIIAVLTIVPTLFKGDIKKAVDDIVNDYLAKYTGGKSVVDESITLNFNIGGTYDNPRVKLMGTEKPEGDTSTKNSTKEALKTKLDKEKKEAEAKAREEMAKQKEMAEEKARAEVEKQKRAAEEKALLEAEKQKKEAEEKTKKQLEKQKKEASKKLKKLF